ncbi:hypothetical protein JHK87_001365 [Glycine soja]|nr:hypothetical protein JHK87_001365 [Glycine soja]
MVYLNWLLSNKPIDLETELTLGFLNHLLLGTSTSPLRKILLESRLGDAIVGGGVEDELLQPHFCIGMKGVFEDDIHKGQWIYDMNPFEPLKYQKHLQHLKSKIAKEGSKFGFSPLIEKFILNNPHQLTMGMQFLYYLSLVRDINGVKVLQYDLFTDDVLYTEIVFNMKSLKQELLPLVPLFW